MKFVLLFLVILPFALSSSTKDNLDSILAKHYRHLSKERRNALTDAWHKIQNWFSHNGVALTAASCSVACASTTALETMGLSAPVCVAACGLIGLFG